MLQVLIADDEARICKLIQILGPWQALDMEVCATASNGVEALELLESKQPDILITDIRMPGCDGLTLISKAKEIKPDLEIIIISGYAHFEYARTSMQYSVCDYLLKPVSKQELTAALEKCAKRCSARRSSEQEREQMLKQKSDLTRLRAGLVRDLQDDCLKEPTAESLDQVYRFSAQTEDRVQAFLLKICSTSGTVNSETLRALHGRANEIFSTTLKDLCHDVLLVFQEETGYGIVSFDPGQRQEVRKALRAAFNQLEVEKPLYGAVCFSLALGTPRPIGELARSYQHAASAILERFIESSGTILESVPTASELPTQSILDRYSRTISHGVEVLSMDSVTGALEQLRSSAMAVRNVRGRELVNLVHTAAGIFTAALALENRDPELRSFYSDCGRCATVNQLFSTLDRFQRRLMEQLIREKETEELRPIRQAKQYIQEHYSDPITLEEVAEVSGFSGSYFSTMFKKETGEGFNQYLTQVRMEEAKALLRDSELPVGEICRQVGYQDLKHFNRLFGREVGLTPGEYRKLYK